MSSNPRPRVVSLSVTAISYLPTVLTGVALRCPYFTVLDDRKRLGGWVITMDPMGSIDLNELMDALPKHMFEILSVTN